MPIKGWREKLLPVKLGGSKNPFSEESADSVVEELIRRVSSTKQKRVHCLFFKVPEPIRRVRSVCYSPQIISFGLYGMRNEQCAMMENVKYDVASAVLEVLLNSTDSAKRKVHSRASGKEKKVEVLWKHLCNQVLPADDKGVYIRNQYSDAPQGLTVDVVQNQLVLDAMFLVSFMLFQHANPQTKSFGPAGFEKYERLLHIFTSTGIFCNINIINSDIWLLENQIPLFLITRMIGEMYLHEGEKEIKGPKEKKAAAEQAFEILIRKTFQKVLRVLPGNYRTRYGEKSDMSVTDKMLTSKTLKKRSHLLECLYRLAVGTELKETLDLNNPNHADSLDRACLLTEEEGVHKNLHKWHTVMKSSVRHLRKSAKGKSTEDATDDENSVSGAGMRKSRILGKVSQPQQKHQNWLDSEKEPADLPHNGILQSPPLQEFEGETGRMRSGSPARYQKSRMSEQQRAESSISQMEQAQYRAGEAASRRQQTSIHTAWETDRQISTSLPRSTITEPSESEEEPVLCLQNGLQKPVNRFLTQICPGETSIGVDSYTLPTVAILREVGIRVKGSSSPGCHCKVELRNSRLPLGNATLHVSPLHVDGIAEVLLRNLVAFEMESASEHKLITYLQCLDDLINTDRDVYLLKEGRHPVILNSSLDERDVATLFNKLLEGCTVYYNRKLEDIRTEVRSYSLQQWRRPWTEFQERYCNGRKPWLAISLFVGSVILTLAAIQTTYTILSYEKPSNS